MISEERLRELIENKQTIYYISELFGERELVEHKYNDRKSIYKYLKNGEYTVDDIYDDCWFETKEEALECLKYGNVTRTEKFPYVSWEEFQKQGNIIRFIDKNGNKCKVEGYFSLPLGGFIDVVQNGTGLCDLEYNKENYLTALDLAVKLFKGEEK